MMRFQCEPTTELSLPNHKSHNFLIHMIARFALISRPQILLLHAHFHNKITTVVCELSRRFVISHHLESCAVNGALEAIN